MSTKTESLKDEGTKLQVILAGATAGLVSRFVIAPLDVVKIRLQLQSHPLLRNTINPSSTLISRRGVWATTHAIIKNEGIRALWKGNVPAELMYISYSAIQFTTYRGVAQLLHHGANVLAAAGQTPGKGKGKGKGKVHVPLALESFVCGAAAGGMATAATYPLDLLRTRLAASSGARHSSNTRNPKSNASNPTSQRTSLLRTIRHLHQTEGSRGFFRGLGPALGQIVPFMGLFFATYETLRVPLGRVDNLQAVGGGDAAAGVVAGVLAKTGVFPLDLVRKRIQVQGMLASSGGGGGSNGLEVPIYERGVGAWKVARTVVKMEGWRGLYRGLSVGLLKAAPASAVTVWTYERVLGGLMHWDERREEGKKL